MSILAISETDWVFGINDPSLIAWIIVLFYAMGTLFSWLAQYAPSVRVDPWKRTLWVVLSILLLFLGFNKQLDLHALVLDQLHDIPLSGIQSNIGLAVVLAMAMGIAAIWLVRKCFIHSNRELRFVYFATVSLLFLQVLRFLPGPTGAILAWHPITEEQGLLHIHIIELIELPIVIFICFWAYRQSSTSAEQTKATHLQPSLLE